MTARQTVLLSHSGGEVIPASAVVLAVGHSSRSMYRALLARDVALAAKPFALGLRVEHPQALIDGIQYGQEYAAGSGLHQNGFFGVSYMLQAAPLYPLCQ